MDKSELEALKKENRDLREKVSSLEREVERLKRDNEVLYRLERLGIADEKYFSRRLKEAVLSAERYARFLCVVLVDVPRTDDKEEEDLPLETAGRLREVFRKTDLVALYDSGKVFVLLEEAETNQGIQALRRVQEEISDIPSPKYSMACYPSDSNKDSVLLELLENRMAKIRMVEAEGPMVHFGEQILPLRN